MKIQHYSLNGEKVPHGIKGFLKYKLPLILYIPIEFLLLSISSFTRKKKTFKYKASLCLIFKDEAKYLREWLEYHIMIGIDHFYLYNNNSTDNFREVLAPYVEKGIVTLEDFPEKYAQVKAYKKCYEHVREETEWLGFIDVDEYVNLIKYNSIGDLLDTVKKYPSVYLNWRMFGTSGHMHENYDELTIERYTQAWANLSSTGKGFINNNFDNHEVSVHFHKSRIGKFPLLGVLANKSLHYHIHFITDSKVAETAYLNHYWSRSLEFYRYKDFVKGDVASAKNEVEKAKSGRFETIELRNSSKDFSIQRWLVFLKERIKK